MKCKAINITKCVEGQQCKFRASIVGYCLAHYYRFRETGDKK